MKLHSRESWGAKKRNGFGSRHLPARRAHIHHTAMPTPSSKITVAEERKIMRRIEAENKYGVLPYNRVIFPSGRVYSGTEATRIGAHTKGYNTTGIGYALMGNFQKKAPTKAQLSALVACIRRDKSKGYLAKRAPIWGHYQTSATACPGTYVKQLLTSIRKRCTL